MPQAPRELQLGLARPNLVPRARVAISAENTGSLVQDWARKSVI
jgi:hypothetical protein